MAVHPLLGTVKNWLELSSEVNDTKLNMILNAVDQVLKEEHGVCVQIETIDTYVNGNDKSVLLLPKVPMNVMSSITIDDVASDITTITKINNFMIKSDDTFTAGIGNIRLVYTTGYASIPNNLQLLYCMLTEKIFKKNKNSSTNVTAASSDFGRVTFIIAESLITKEMQSLLTGYVIPAL